MNPYSHGRGHYASNYQHPNSGHRDATNQYCYSHRPRGRAQGYYQPMRQTILNFRGFRDPDAHPLLLLPPPPEYGYQASTLQENAPNLQGIRPELLQKGPTSFGRGENLRNRSLQENQWHNIRPPGNQSNAPGSNQNVWGQIRTTVGPNIEISTTATPPPQQQDGVKMKALPFFEVIGVPLQTLVNSRGPSWNFYCRFSLKESLLSHFQNKNPPAPYFVHLRFCKNDQSDLQKDYFPSDIHVLVNNQKCFLPGWNSIPRGTPGPVDITNKCDFQGNLNYINVRTRERMVLFVNVTKRLTPDDLLKKLLAKAHIESSATVAKIKEKLQQDSVSGDDITLTSLHFSLLCPVSKARMKYPCRASTCQHLQCFDAAYYFKMNEKKPKWTCPVCFVVIEYQALQIDQYFKNVLDENISTEKILLQADGTYKPFQSKGGNQSVLTLDDTTDTFTTNESRDHKGIAHNTTPADDTSCSYGGGGGSGACVSRDSEDSFFNNCVRDRRRGGQALISDTEDSFTDNRGGGGVSGGGGGGAFIPLSTKDPLADNHGNETLAHTTPRPSSANSNVSNLSDYSGNPYPAESNDFIPLSYTKSHVYDRDDSPYGCYSPDPHRSNFSGGGGGGEAEQVTIDLLSEDESLLTNDESASSRITQTRSVPEIVILSDDECPSPELHTPSGILGWEFTSTPKAPKPPKRKKQKRKKTPKMTRIIPDTTTPIGNTSLGDDFIPL